MMNDNRTVTLRVKAREFHYVGGYLIFDVKENDALEVMPTGTYNGFNWWKPLRIDSIRNLIMGVLNSAN
jgi:hypothetical protein